MQRRSMLVLMAMLVAQAPGAVQAQVHLTVQTSLVEHRGHAYDALDSEGASLMPATAREFAIGIGMDRGTWRLSLTAATSSPDLLVLGDDTGIVTRNVLESTTLGIAIGPRILGGPGQAELHLLAGATINRWSFSYLGDPARNRTLFTIAAEGAMPLTGSIRGVMRLEGGFGSSLFYQDDLPEGYQTRGARRVSMAVGLRWQH
jgi:hypothetical protein